VIRSMTGYGSSNVENDSLQANVSVRSLNHRHLDVSVHLSRSLQALEREVRALVESRLDRGRVDVVVQASFRDPDAETVSPDATLVTSLVRSLRQLKQEHELAGEVAISDVARFPGALEVVEHEINEGRRREVLELVSAALDQLEAMRRSEGDHLAEHLARCLEQIESAAVRIESLSATGKAQRREALLEKVRGLASEAGMDEGRIHAEVVRLVDRSDVSEEVERLRSHVTQARQLMGAEVPAGKRLDFLAQELMREANTVGSKSASAPLTHEVVALKGEIEKFREQVQNVE